MMTVVTALLTSAFAAGGGLLCGLIVQKTGLQEQVPQALWAARVLGGIAWVRIFQRLWGDVMAAWREPS